MLTEHKSFIADPLQEQAAAARSGGYSGREIINTVNALETPWGTDDLTAAISAEPGRDPRWS